MKTCPKCGLEKTEADFHRSTKRGLQHWCKLCMKSTPESQRARSAKFLAKKKSQDPNYVRNLSRAYRKTLTYEDKEKDRLRAAEYRLTKWWIPLFSQCVESSKTRGHSPPTISAQWVFEQYQRQSQRCYHTGVLMRPSAAPRDLFQPSLDRLDNARGYDPENVVLTCWAANMARGSASLDEFTNWIKLVREEQTDAVHKAIDKI